LLKISE